MRIVETDVLIIGSGFGAAAPALRLAEAGHSVTMIEKGPRLDPLEDFRQTQDPKYLLTYLKGMSGDNLSVTYAEALGGGSGFYEMVSLRAPSRAFHLLDDGGRPLWPAPVDRTTLDPYYDIADRMLHVEQIPAEEVPKSGLVFSLMMRNLGYTTERARYAVRGCVGSGFCVTGCIYGAKQSLLLNYLPQAVEAGVTIESDREALTVRPLSDVLQVPGSGSLATIPHRYEVLCKRRAGTRGSMRYRAKLLILAGGTIGTARLLLSSREYLPSLSDQVGRNISFNGSVKAAALLPNSLPDGDMYTGRSHPGIVSYEFLDSHGIMVTAGKPLPLQAVASARLKLDGDERSPAHWGAPHVELMKQYRNRMVVLVAFGMTPPLGELTVLGPDKFELRLPITEGLRDYYRETKALLQSIMLRNECRLVDAEFVNREGDPHPDIHFSTSHQVGSCRMAESRAHGVVNADGEVFAYPGMYVSDGAAIPSSLAVNTSLTILANAERVAAGILARHRAERPVIAIRTETQVAR